MNLLLEQMMLHRGATQHLAYLAMHGAGSMTREELVQARAVFDEVGADMVKIDDAFLEFEGSGNAECGAGNDDQARKFWEQREVLAAANARRLFRPLLAGAEIQRAEARTTSGEGRGL